MTGLPSGAVTFLFSDIEGSTRLVKALRERYAKVLAEHRSLVRAALADQAGYEVDTQGDAVFIAFAGAKQAVLCALEVQRALARHEWPAGAQVRVRIGIHTGQAVPDGGAYTGLAVHRAARICAAARGGQVLVSQATFRDFGARLNQAEALNRLGELSSQISATEQAREQHTQALAIARDIGMPFEEARALEGLGRAYLHDGNAGQAAAHLHQALSIFQSAGSPRAGRIQATLRDHGL